MSWTLPIICTLLFIGLLYAAATFSALETALIALRERAGISLGARVQQQNPILANWLSLPNAGVHEILLLGALANLLLIATGLYLVLYPLNLLGAQPILSTVVLLGMGLMVVEVIPKVCALRAPESTVQRSFPLFLAIRHCVAPFALPLREFSDRVIQAVSKTPDVKSLQSLGELETLVLMKTEEGAISQEESGYLKSLLYLDDLTAKELMTPRVDLVFMPYDASNEEAMNMLESARTCFIAVFDQKKDAIAYLIDVHRWKLAGRPHWSQVLTKPVFVPSTQLVLSIYGKYLQDNRQAAVVVDEYGGFEGLLTRNHVYEKILGRIAPFGADQGKIQLIGPQRYLVEGIVSFAELKQETGVDLDDALADTLGGYVMNHFGYPPKPGEIMIINNVHIKVKKTAKARIQKLEVRVLNTTESGESL